MERRAPVAPGSDEQLQLVQLDELQAKGYPSLRYIKDGKFYEWRGAKRTIELFESYIESRYRSAPSHPLPYSATAESAAAALAYVKQVSGGASSASGAPARRGHLVRGPKETWSH